MYEQGNVFRTLSEGWNANLDRTQAVEQIFAEPPCKNFGAEVAVRSGDQMDIDLFDFRRSDPLDFAILNDPQELGLHGERGFADFVEKDGAPVCVFEQTGPGIGGASKRTADMAKKLAFEQGVNQRRAIAHREPLRADWAKLVDGACDEFLAGAGLADNENVRIVPRDLAREVEHFEHCRTFADDAVKFKIL